MFSHVEEIVSLFAVRRTEENKNCFLSKRLETASILFAGVRKLSPNPK